MSFASVVGLIIANLPTIIGYIQKGQQIEAEINAAFPGLLSSIATGIESLFPHVNGGNYLSTVLAGLEKPPATIPGYGSDGSVIDIKNPDAG